MLSRTPAYLLAVLLLAAGAWRIGSMVSQQPVLGYANQFDMGRTSACLGLWPNLPARQRYEASPAAPIGRYAPGDVRADECYLSSELLFSGAAIVLWKAAAALHVADAASMDLRFIGSVKGGALVLLALAISWLFRRWPAWTLTHAAVFALVLADPVVTLWLNTLYTEFAAVFFLYASIVTLAVIVVEQPDRPGWYTGFGLSLVGLGLSRQQHLLLPAFLVTLALPALWGQYRRALAPIAFAAVAVVALQLFVVPHPATITAANNVDVVLGTLLPASPRQERALDVLGLPSSCAGVIGATWYVTMGEDLALRCPDVMTLRRSQLLNFIVVEPVVVPLAFMRAAPLSQSPLLRYVGVEEKWSYAALEKQSGINGYSIGTPIERMPPEFFLGALLLALIAFPLSLLAWSRTIVRNGSPSLESVLGAALSGTLVYAFTSSLLGDGIVEIGRHVHLGNVAMQVMAVLAVTLAVSRLVALGPGHSGRRPPAVALASTPWYGWSFLIAAIFVAATAPIWLGLWQQQSLAVGVVDEPENNRYDARTVLLHGWAMDPFGPVRTYAIVNGKTHIDSRYWAHPVDPHGTALSRALPTYLDPATARFEIAIDTAPYGNAPIAVRTYARTSDGVVTEIDRRTLARAKP